MGKNAKAAAQRAKNEKDKKREQKVLADRKRRQRVEASLASAASGRRGDLWGPLRGGIEALARREHIHPHEALKIALAYLDEDDEEPVPEEIWTPRKVAAVEDDALLEMLGQLGVQVERVPFVRAAADLRSAWRIANDVWLPTLAGRPIRPLEQNFLGLAACALWERWCPELPSMERVIDQIDDGYDSLEDDSPYEATVRWLDFWERLRAFLTPEVRTLHAAQELIGTTCRLDDWLVSFTAAAVDAHLRGPQPELVPRVVKALEEVLDQFASEGAEMRAAVGEDLGMLLFAAGRPEDGERVLRELIAHDPDQGVYYVKLAEAWAPEGKETRAGVERALALLEEAAVRPIEDAAVWDFPSQISHMKRLLDQLGAGSPLPSDTRLVYKVCAATEWRQAVDAGAYRGSSLDLRDGFIHLSTAAQLAETLRRHFAGQRDLVLVAFDPDDLGDLRWEPSRGDELFPHVYGELPSALARAVTHVDIDENGHAQPRAAWP